MKPSADNTARASDIERLAKELAIAIRSTAKAADEVRADFIFKMAMEAAKS